MAKTKISRVPETLDLALYAGDGVAIRLSLTNSTGDPIGVTGTMRAQIRTSRSSPEVSAEFTAVPEDNAIVISLTGEQTQALVSGDEPFAGVWDLQWVPEGGEPATLVRGQVTCDADVTR
ncbi:MAG TPA: hypothetical protein VM715_06520 [Candidatus Acidoferrum sp.]|nr:hypothetical protein [Candidatus Acidoferrum sp.]